MCSVIAFYMPRGVGGEEKKYFCWLSDKERWKEFYDWDAFGCRIV